MSHRYAIRVIVLVGVFLVIRTFTADVRSDSDPLLGSHSVLGNKGAGSPMQESGERLYQRYCASCHGIDARGGGPAAKALKTPPPDLTKIADRRDGRFPDADIAGFIDGRTEVDAHGSRTMPIWGQVFGEVAGGGEIGDEVTRGKIAVLVEYLKSVQR